MALTQEFKTKEANAAFDHALLLNPNYSNYYIAKGLGLYKQGKYAGAESYIDKGLVLNPNYSFGWDAKGIIAEAKGDKPVAIFAYNKAIKLNPEDTTALKAVHRLEHPWQND